MRNLAFVEEVERKMVRPVGKRAMNTIVDNHNITQGKSGIYEKAMRDRNIDPHGGGLRQTVMRRADANSDMRAFLLRGGR